MGFVDSFINTYTQQQQLKQQRQEWETQQALREADAIARQQDMRERAIDRDLDRDLKRQSMLDMEEQRKWSREDREDERKRKREKDRRDAIEHSLKMGYTPKQAEAMADGRSDVPQAYKPKPLKKQIGVAEGDVLANAPANIAEQLSKVLPQMFGGVAGIPAQQGMQAAGPMMQQVGAQGVDEHRAAIDIANEVLQEQNAQGMEQAQMQGNLPSPEFMNREALDQNRIKVGNAGINDKLAQREIQRQALELQTQKVISDIQSKADKLEFEKQKEHNVNTTREGMLEVARTRETRMKEMWNQSAPLKKLQAEIAAGNLDARKAELEFRKMQLSGTIGLREKTLMSNIRKEARIAADSAMKQVSVLSQNEQSQIRAIEDAVTELEKMGIKDPNMIRHRTHEMHQKLADIRTRLQEAKTYAAKTRGEYNNMPGVKLVESGTDRPVPKPKPVTGAPKADLTKMSTADLLKRLAETAGGK